MKHLHRFNFAFFILFIGISSCGEAEKSEAKSETNTSNKETEGSFVVRKSDLKLTQVKNGSISNTALISGRVVPKNSTELFAEVQGSIQQGSDAFKTGTPFSKGQVLLRINSREFALNLEAQKSAFLNILTGMMPDLKADYPDNYQNWLAYVSSYASGKPLPPLPETKATSEKYFVTANQVYNTFYSIKAQEERLSKYSITAPFDGILTAALVDMGGLVSPGQPLGTFISEDDLEIEAGVALDVASALKIGDEITFRSNKLPGQWVGVVSRVNGTVDAKTQNITVFLALRGDNIKPGVYLEGQVGKEHYENAFTIESTLLSRDQNLLVLKDSTINKQEVRVLASKTDSLIVSGLNDNDQLILNTFEVPVAGLKILD